MATTTFPRGAGAMPRMATPPRFPGALQSWGQSGKGQYRSMQNMGRMWTEIYGPLDTANPNVRALLAALNQSLREGTLWSVQHPYWQVRKGVGGGTPLINGGGQSGSAIVVDGAPVNTTAWLRAGDLLVIAGGAVVYDVVADVNTDASGGASIPINPPIFVGREPIDGTAVTIDPTAITFTAHLVAISDYPDMDNSRFLQAGLTLTWREQPQ